MRGARWRVVRLLGAGCRVRLKRVDGVESVRDVWCGGIWEVLVRVA